ncbi:MAG: hypothetical protein HS116_20940 [Planctomycetes bacterium]|nr:hypothetical protein [Planctomycetota bacterium]
MTPATHKALGWWGFLSALGALGLFTLRWCQPPQLATEIAVALLVLLPMLGVNLRVLVTAYYLEPLERRARFQFALLDLVVISLGLASAGSVCLFCAPDYFWAYGMYVILHAAWLYALCVLATAAQGEPPSKRRYLLAAECLASLAGRLGAGGLILFNLLLQALHGGLEWHAWWRPFWLLLDPWSRLGWNGWYPTLGRLCLYSIPLAAILGILASHARRAQP